MGIRAHSYLESLLRELFKLKRVIRLNPGVRHYSPSRLFKNQKVEEEGEGEEGEREGEEVLQALGISKDPIHSL